MTPIITEYAAALKGTPILGHVAFYGVAECRLDHDDLVARLAAVGLESYAPSRPNSGDVFRRITSAAQAKRVTTDDPAVYVNVLVRDVSRSTESITKRIVSESVDAAGRRLTYLECFDLTYVKAGEHVSVSPLAWNVAQENPAAAAVARSIVPAFAAAVGTHNSDAVRTLMSRVLDRIHAIRLKSTGGGVFFVPEANTPVVEALTDFADSIDACEFHPMPLVDSARQRGLVTKAFEAESTADIDAQVMAVIELLRAGAPVSSARYAALMADFTHSRERLETYGDLLETKLSATASRLMVFERAMVDLLRLTAQPPATRSSAA